MKRFSRKCRDVLKVDSDSGLPWRFTSLTTVSQ
jgi:hypothetical protein